MHLKIRFLYFHFLKDKQVFFANIECKIINDLWDLNNVWLDDVQYQYIYI